jgi:hypothetical protein
MLGQRGNRPVPDNGQLETRNRRRRISNGNGITDEMEVSLDSRIDLTSIGAAS